jgi:hypothetical protein
MATASQYVPNFTHEPQRFTLLNSAPEPLTVRWHGVQFTIPASDKIGPRPAMDADGDPIPGTAVLQDSYCPGQDGNYPTGGQYNWLAAEVIKNALGINPLTGEAEGPFAKKGLSFLPDKLDKKDIEVIKKAGVSRWKTFLVEWANYEVSAYREAADKASRLGIAAPPPGPDYTKAILILKANEDLIKKQIGEGNDLLDRLQDGDDEIEFLAYAKAAALAAAEKAAASKAVDKQVVAEQMLEDPEIMKHLRKKFRIRKIGHLPDEGEE